MKPILYSYILLFNTLSAKGSLRVLELIVFSQLLCVSVPLDGGCSFNKQIFGQKSMVVYGRPTVIPTGPILESWCKYAP